ncbi:Hypothetical protein A7982_11001 [Minicystis rosea]|nr:Hypothetical protein A7982_11001 [Minicystis rosea]
MAARSNPFTIITRRIARGGRGGTSSSTKDSAPLEQGRSSKTIHDSAPELGRSQVSWSDHRLTITRALRLGTTGRAP